MSRESEYYRRNLDDPSLYDQAVVIPNAFTSYATIEADGSRNEGPVVHDVCCVPVGGSRRGGHAVVAESAAQRVVATLTGMPGFPNPRIRLDGDYAYSVMWGDEEPVIERQHDGLDWLRHHLAFGQYFGYSRNAIVWHLGRMVASELLDDWRELPFEVPARVGSP